MSESTLEQYRAVVVPGPGVVVRFVHGFLAFAGTPEDIAAAMLAVGVDRLDQDPDDLEQSLRAAIGQHEVAGVVRTDREFRALAASVMQVRDQSDQVLSRTTRVDQHMADCSSGAWVGAGDPVGDINGVLDLRLGAVPGSGIVFWDPTAVTAESPKFLPRPGPLGGLPGGVGAPAVVARPWPAPDPSTLQSTTAPSSDETGAFVSATHLSADEPAPARPASPSWSRRLPVDPPVAKPPIVNAPTVNIPLIRGIRCINQHFNKPNAFACYVCGAPLDRERTEMVEAPRPPLGRLVFDGGEIVPLDRERMIGRDPQPGDRADTHSLVIADRNKSVSRSHAEVFFDGWEVGLVDLESANGSYRWNQVLEKWQRLDALVPIRLVDGDVIALGQRRFVFDGL